MDIATLAFYAFALAAVASALGVITIRNPVHAALLLVLTFFSIAATWILAGAEFLGLALVVVYVGAVMVLFLFVVMMLDINLARLREGFWSYLPIGAVVALLLVAAVYPLALGLAMHAAERYGCRVTTTTISREQHDFAKAKIAERGLSDRITLLFKDYRDLTGQFDKLVSIEMIEAVGARYLDTYFSKCSSLLKPTGAMLLQAITLQDQYYAQALKSVDYIQRFVFPGSFIPSVQAITNSVAKVTDMKMFNLEDIGPHYAPTLRMWRERFFANIQKVKELGYPDSFVRLWEFYLCYCEGGFAERQLGDVQMLLTKPDCRRAAIAAA